LVPIAQQELIVGVAGRWRHLEDGSRQAAGCGAAMALAATARYGLVAAVAIPRCRATTSHASSSAGISEAAKLCISVPGKPFFFAPLEERLDAQIVGRVPGREVIEHLVEFCIILSISVVEKLVNLLKLQIAPVTDNIGQTEKTAVAVLHECRTREAKAPFRRERRRGHPSVLCTHRKAVDAHSAISGSRVAVEL
jgi:hypothetical protein